MLRENLISADSAAKNKKDKKEKVLSINIPPFGHPIKNILDTVLILASTLGFFSAGIGRTGCFIATSILCKQLRTEGVVDILRTTCQLRLDR